MSVLNELPSDVITFQDGKKLTTFQLDGGNFVCRLCHVKNINGEIGVKYHRLGNAHKENWMRRSGFFDEEYLNIPTFRYESANGKNMIFIYNDVNFVFLNCR